MTKETLLLTLEETTQVLLRDLSAYSPENFNRRPADNAWSAAQIAEHILKVGHAAYKIVNGETVPTNRLPDSKIDIIRQTMDDEAKRVSPERVQPSSGRQDPTQVAEEFKKLVALLKDCINSLDITEACVSFKNSLFGTLTRMEWVAFYIYHTKRHIKQLAQLKENLIYQ